MSNNNKEVLIKNFIQLLTFEPWSKKTLELAIVEAGMEKDYLEVLYPGGIREFTQEFIDNCNKYAFAEFNELNLDNLKIREKISQIILSRISLYHETLGSLEALKKFAAYCANPKNIGDSLKNIYNFSSEAWYEIGDKSTDFNYYTKRISLSSVYSKAFLYSMSDESNNLENTASFIERTIDGLMKINSLKQSFNGLLSKTPIKFRV